MRSTHSRRLIAAAGALTLAVSLAACGSGRTDNASSSATTTSTAAAPAGSGSSSAPAGSTAAGSTASGGSASSSAPAAPTGPAIKIGTTDQVVSLDPAGSYDNGSLMLETQLYQFLVVIPAGQKVPTPDAASKCGFTDKGATYTCTMKPGLKFSNGDPLTAKDVEFTFNRIITINDPNGPASLLANMKSVKATDATTVVFTLNTPNDQTFPFILGTSAGPIVDSKVFPANKLLDDAKVIGSGPYKLAAGYQKNQLAALAPNSNYQGNGGAMANSGVTLQYFTDASNLKLAVQQGTVDVAWRSLDAQSISDLRKDSKVKVLDGPGGELRYMVFNLNTMPGGTAAQKLAVRRAVAFSVDRQALATDIYQDTYTPVYSMVPDGLPGHVDAFKTEFGATPDKTKAAAALSAAGVTTPVTINLQYALGHYGPTSADEYGEIKRQLEATGLFKVNLQSTEWTTYSKERRADAYPVYQLGWFPDFPDADNYISPFLVPNNFVGAHYCDDPKTVKTAVVGSRPCDTDKVLPLIATEQSGTGAARTAAIEKIQTIGATGEMPTLPLLQGKQIAVTGTNVTGVDKTLDSTFLFRFWLIGKTS
ncbi:peptide/nickel transport system substrate-binding protein [Nakamurella panacisegetis]|uniref:Peptide/nickel transport system substrate-binding protein n=1 Tax=Nakamurella panacisegetis TaxID=1090615 RepID=A0A1H0N280_9ACTN|nr:ABC transporter substrate-binding protein [Nakamurella panacisegetis]SDO86480.1 peptide/nickel transport system substrate-binding protein [Nakamurella panacisegetis]